MPVLNIDGRRVQVPESFRNLSPEDQNKTVEEIVSQMGGDVRGASGIPDLQIPEEEPGIFGRIARAFTGGERLTERARETPELSFANLLEGEDQAPITKVAALSLVTPKPEEMAQILQANFPNIAIETDQQGNIYAVNTDTGNEAILNRPGFSYSDFISLVGLGLSFTPAGRGLGASTRIGRIGQVGGRSGLTATAIEEAQAAGGGEFNPEDIAIETVLGAGGQAAGEGIGALARMRANRLAQTAERATQAAEAAEAQRIGQPLSPEAQRAQMQETLGQIAGAVEQVGTKPPDIQLPKLRELAENADIDPEALAAAGRLGVADDLLPSQLARNPEYIEIEQGLASIIGSQLNAQQKMAYQKVAQKADDLITEFGGTLDKVALSEQLRNTILKNIDQLSTTSDQIYAEVNKIIPGKTRVPMPHTLHALRQEIIDQGGLDNLEPVEQAIFKMANNKNGSTYANLDKERQKLGAAIQKREGPYKDMETGMLKRLYSLTISDQQQAADELGAGNLFRMGRKYVDMRKNLERKSLVVLGRDKAGAIMPKIGEGVKKLQRGDFKAFDQAIDAIAPEDRQLAVLSALNDAFTGSTREHKQLSVPTFVNWYNSLNRMPEAKKRIMQHLPKEAQSRLDDLFKVAEAMNRAGKERVTTGRLRTLLDDFQAPGGMVSKLYATGKDAAPTAAAAEVATAVATGVPGVGGTVAGVVRAMAKPAKDPLSKAAGNLLADPQFQQLAREMARSNVGTEAALQKAADAVTRSQVYQDWLDQLPSDLYRQALRLGVVLYFSSPDPEPQPYAPAQPGMGTVQPLTQQQPEAPTQTQGQ